MNGEKVSPIFGKSEKFFVDTSIVHNSGKCKGVRDGRANIPSAPTGAVEVTAGVPRAKGKPPERGRAVSLLEGCFEEDVLGSNRTAGLRRPAVPRAHLQYSGQI